MESTQKWITSLPNRVIFGVLQNPAGNVFSNVLKSKNFFIGIFCLFKLVSSIKKI